MFNAASAVKLYPNKRSEAMFYLNTLLSSVFFSITGVACSDGSTFFPCLIRELGASGETVSLIPIAWCVAALPSSLMSYVSQRVGRDRELALAAITVSAVVMGAASLVIALADISLRFKLILIFAALIIGHLCTTLYFICYFAWLPEVVGAQRSGRVMSGRLWLWCIARLVALPVCGHILKLHPEVETFGLMFAAASLLGVASALPLAFIPAAPRLHHVKDKPSANPLELLGEVNFRRMMAMVFLVNLACFLVGGYAVIFVKEYLEFSYDAVGYAFALPGLFMMLTILGWGRLADTYGAKGVCMIGVCGIAIGPLLFMLNVPGHTTMVWVAMIWGGAINSAYSVAWLPLLYTLAPKQKRASAIAAVWFVCAAAGLVTPLAAGLIVRKVGNAALTIGTWRFGGLHLLLFGQAVLAGLAIPLCKSIRPPNSVPTRRLMKMFAQNPLRTLWAAVYGDILLRSIARGNAGDTEAPATDASDENRSQGEIMSH